MRALKPVLALIMGALVFASVACDNGEDEDATAPVDETATAAGTPPLDLTTTAAGEVVQVFLLNEENFVAGEEPFVTPVQRQVDLEDVERAALEQLFRGPTATELAQGLRFEASGATGFSEFRIEDGIATVQLEGGCDSGGSTFTVAQEIIPTLTQFSSIEYVKILDPEGNTSEPEGPSNSIPACLEP